MSEAQVSSVLEKLPTEYRPLVEQYLSAAANNEDWLENFPRKMEWIFEISWSDLAKEFAKSKKLLYQETRKEPTQTIGYQIAELVQRRHTAINALIPKQSGEPAEFMWGSGWKQVDNNFSAKGLLRTYRDATDRLLQTLITTPTNRDIVQKDWKTGQITRHLTPLDVIKELTAHEVGHTDMFRILFDTLTAPFPPSYKKAITTPIQK